MLQQAVILLRAIILRLLWCKHPKAQAVVGKTYCPDCGQGIVYEWWLIRCQGCQRYRKARWLMGVPWLEQHFCIECGMNAFKVERYTEPPLYHLDKVLIHLKTVHQPCALGIVSSREPLGPDNVMLLTTDCPTL